MPDTSTPAEPTLAEQHGPVITLPVVKFHPVRQATGEVQSPTKQGTFAAHRQQRREKRDRRR